MTTDIVFADFIKPAFRDNHKYTIIRAGRQTGKTFGATQWICLMLMGKNSKGLWVDTIQANISKYIERYFKPILGELWHTVQYDKKANILTFGNGSILDFGSAERPELLEGFGYDFVVLNEAGIILKKEGLWEKTIQPMTQNAITKIIGTPKGKSDKNRKNKKSVYFELSEKCKTDEEWIEYHFTCYDSPYWLKEKLDKLKASISSHIFIQEYLAEFADVYENSLIDFEDLRFWDYINLDQFDKLYMHADTTHTGKTTSDYFSLVVLGENIKDKNYYVIDFILEKLDVEKQARKSIVMYQKYKSKVNKFTYDEKANQGFGFWIKKLAREEYNVSLPIQELNYSADKVSHFTPHIPHFKANRVYLPSLHNDIEIAQSQLLAFPEPKANDDFVDGISGVLDNFKLDDDFYYSVV